MIKLGLSGRIIEQITDEGRDYQMSAPQFIETAAEIGYRGVEMRWWQLNSESSDEEVAKIARALGENGVACAFINCLVDAADETLKDVERMSDIARQLASAYIRVHVNDIEWVQQACDIADNYEVALVAQIHTNSPLETVEGAMRVCEQIDRDNFGLTYEPANFVLAGRDYGREAVETIREKLFNVTIQNLKPVQTTEGEGVIVHEGRGFVRCAPDDPEGVDFAKAFEALKSVDYNGYATLIEPISDVMDNLQLADEYFKHLQPLC
ncbi:MAG: sugar phosphate isomerase/epimerase family protein [Armatimonadota bacterium]